MNGVSVLLIPILANNRFEISIIKTVNFVGTDASAIMRSEKTSIEKDLSDANAGWTVAYSKVKTL
jgi:hypothetical protein